MDDNTWVTLMIISRFDCCDAKINEPFWYLDAGVPDSDRIRIQGKNDRGFLMHDIKELIG